MSQFIQLIAQSKTKIHIRLFLGFIGMNKFSREQNLFYLRLGLICRKANRAALNSSYLLQRNVNQMSANRKSSPSPQNMEAVYQGCSRTKGRK